MDLTDDDYAIIRRVAANVGRARWIPREDLVQEAAIRLWRSDYDPMRCERGAFVASVAKLAMLDWLRSFRGRRAGSKMVRRPTYCDPDHLPERGISEAWEAIDARLDAARYLRRYPRRTREALRLRYLEGLTAQECARRMGVTKAGYFWILRVGSDRPMNEPILAEPLFVDANTTKPPKRSTRKPDELRALVPDMPAFLASLPPVTREDVRDWLGGESVEAIAKRHGVRVPTVRNNVWRAFVRALERNRVHEGHRPRLP